MKTHRRLGALVLAFLVVSAILLGSCSNASPSPTKSETSAQGTPAQGTLAQDSKPSGSLTIASGFFKNSFDPLTGSISDHQGYAAAVLDSLVDVDPNGQARPGIAERWNISDDGKVHTFNIRKGVKFHNGDDLTGADVKFSIERMLGPTSTHTDSPIWRSMIDRVDLKDDYTVVIYLKQPLFELLKGFADFSGSTAVLPKKYIEEKGIDYFRKNPVGSGPFKVLSWTPSIRLELEAVENHWRATPKFKNVTIQNVAEEATKNAMLRTGELDMAVASPDSLRDLKAAGLNVLPYNGGAQQFAYIFYDLDNPQKYAFSDVRVRKALSLATNRKELADKIYVGYAEPSVLYYVLKTAYFFDTSVLKPDSYDPEGAKKLLAEAGYPNGFKTSILDMGGGSAVTTVNQALTGYFRNVGITAELRPLDYATAISWVTPKQVPDVWNTLWSWISTGVFQYEKMMVTYHSTKGWNRNLRNPQLDELIEKVPVTRDPAEKKRIATQSAVMARDEYNILAMLDLQTIFVHGSKIGQVTPTIGMTGFSLSLETLTHGK